MSEKHDIEIVTVAGHPIRVVVGWFWQDVAPDGYGRPLPPTRIHAIHVLTSEDNSTLRLKLRHEFRANFDYSMGALSIIKAWLDMMQRDRRQGDYETVEEFLEEFADFIAEPEGFQLPRNPAKRHNSQASTSED